MANDQDRRRLERIRRWIIAAQQGRVAVPDAMAAVRVILAQLGQQPQGRLI